MECPLQLFCRTGPTFCSPSLDQVETEGPARDGGVRRAGLQAGIGHIFFELPCSQYSMKVSFWKRPKSEAPTNFDELCFSAAVPEQPLPTAACSLLTPDVLSYTGTLLSHTRCCMLCCV